MKAIDKIIFNELASRRAVVLPGLGTLGVVRRPAQITGREVMPPVNQVVFSKEEAGDAPAVTTLMEAMGVSREAAANAYSEWLADARKNEEMRMEGVGTLAKGVFTPSDELAQMLNPMRQHAAADESTAHAATRTSGDGYDRKKGRCLTNILLAVAILLLLLILWLCFCHRGGFCGGNGCGVRAETIENTIAAEENGGISTPENTDTQTDPQAGIQPGVQSGSQSPDGQTVGQSAKKYHLIAGSFIYESNADEFVDKVRRQFPELSVEKIVTVAWVMVSVYQGADEAEVEAANRKLAARLGKHDMWIYRKK